MNHSWIDLQIERYLEELSALTSASSSAFFSSDYSSTKTSSPEDTKLLRMIAQANRAKLFRYCNQLQMQVMFAKVGGRAFLPGPRRFIGQPQATLRRLTNAEIAMCFGFKLRKLECIITQAYRLIQRAIDDELIAARRAH